MQFWQNFQQIETSIEQKELWSSKTTHSNIKIAQLL
jgi:hypothetical protein